MTSVDCVELNQPVGLLRRIRRHQSPELLDDMLILIRVCLPGHFVFVIGDNIQPSAIQQASALFIRQSSSEGSAPLRERLLPFLAFFLAVSAAFFLAAPLRSRVGSPPPRL